MACCIPVLLTTFLFPLTGIYSFTVVPTLAALFFGAIIISAAAIYEFKFLYWCGIAVWIGGCIGAYAGSPWRGIIMIVIVFIGFVIPGIIFNRKYKDGRKSNGA